MTPHRHWVRNYTPLRIPIRLADNTTVYSAGVGTVRFNPIIKGQPSDQVEFSRVLHVPALRNNLLSCLFLTKHKGFTIYINSKAMHFNRDNTTLFYAPISNSISAQLDGHVVPEFESANLVSTLPLDLSLWHRRCAHHGYADIAKMEREEMVTGIRIESKQKPDPICEPCLAGKMHSNPFPSSPSRSTTPLELIHTDLHGPLNVSTREGYRYWITFIDDCTSFRTSYLLKRKSEAFEAFKSFKAYAENQLNVKIKSMQDDKAGEYMSKAFIKFCDDCGIVRRHTVRNRPQQNGVAERANRTMSDDITAMLAEARLPPSFWGECLLAQLHIWNRLPTSTLSNMTPWEAWFKQKPDIGHLRIWGCLAYVFIQRDQRKSLQTHMVKCIFVGYPKGYKGWKFYNPVTKKFIISERAEFDERVFPSIAGFDPKVKLTFPLVQTGHTPDVQNVGPVLDFGGMMKT